MPEQGSSTDYFLIMVPPYENKTDRYGRPTVCCGLTTREILKFTIQLLLPLSLGIFTIVVTLYQQEVTKQQRFEDRQIASEQREQDLNISARQREQDKQIAREQREEDEQRRYQDLNISSVRRDLDLTIALLKRDADDRNAEKQRNMSRDQRQHELTVEHQRYETQLKIEKDRYVHENEKYFNGLALSYINEIGALFDKNNGSLMLNPTTAALARAKTFNVIAQIGANRSKQLIQFLHDANQLKSNAPSLDLSGVLLNGIDFRGSTMNNLSLVGFHLNGAIFDGLKIFNWNFEHAHLNGASFRSCIIFATEFNEASMIGIDFSSSHFHSVSFRGANMINASFRNVETSYERGNIGFDGTNLEATDFTNSRFGRRKNNSYNLYFVFSNLTRTIFRYAELDYAQIRNCDLTRVDLTGAIFNGIEISKSTLAFASIISVRTVLKNSMFLFTNLSHVNFTGSKCGTDKCRFDLSISTHNALMPDGTIDPSRPTYIRASSAHSCLNSLLSDDGVWEISNNRAHIIVRPELSSPIGLNGCVFLLTASALEAVMKQVVNVNWFSDLIKKEEAVATFRASISQGIQIIVEERLDKKSVLRQHSLLAGETLHSSSSSRYVISEPLILNKLTTQFHIKIYFNQRTEDSTARWLEYIEMEINPLLTRF